MNAADQSARAHAELPAKQYAQVLGQSMAYVEVGDGDPIVFLHGNPTSSYLWRNVLPSLSSLGRCIAPDLIGMGDSAKLPDSGPGSYRFTEHRQYVDALLAALEITDRVTLVIHDWGSALGFDWASRNRDAIKGIAYMEAIVRPLTWEEWPQRIRRVFRSLRSPDGEQTVLRDNIFVEKLLPAGTLGGISDDDLDSYRRPFLEPGESRRPTLTWPRELPIGGEPADVCDIVDAYAGWLSASPVPKLFINAEPGAILVGAQREFCRRWPNQTEVTVAGRHYVQEDSAKEIAAAVASWYQTIQPGGSR